MSAINCPESVSTQELQFKQLCKLRISKSLESYKIPVQLVAISNSFGLIFTGDSLGFKVVAVENVLSNIQDKKAELHSYLHRFVSLPSSPTHLSLNSEQSLLGVTYLCNDVPILRLYKVDSFHSQDIVVISDIRLSSVSGAFVKELIWTPANQNLLACCISDGILTIYSIQENGSYEITTLPNVSQSTCACWSPLGKQIVIGNAMGTLIQCTLELKPVKKVEPPPNFFQTGCSVANIKWLSTIQFIVVYVENNVEQRPYVMVVNAPKQKPVTYVNYEDVCYSSGTYRLCQFYFIHISAWNIVLVASGNGVEISVLGLNKENALWYLLNLEDSKRADLPLDKESNETYPVGFSVDFSSRIQTAVGDKMIAMPILNILSSDGVLCMYLINNLSPNVESVCAAPIGTGSTQFFTTELEEKLDKPKASSNDKIEVITPEVSPRSEPVISEISPVESPVISEVPAAKAAEIFSSSKVPASVIETSLSNFGMPIKSVPIVTTSASNTNVAVPNFENVPRSLQSINLKISEEVKLVPEAAAVKQEDTTQKQREMVAEFKAKLTSFLNETQEIKEVVETLSTQNVKLDDLQHFGKQIADLENNFTSVKEKIQTSKSNIHEVNELVIEIYASLAEVKYRKQKLTDPAYRSLLNINDFELFGQMSLKERSDLIYYIQSQIKQAHKQLDDAWFNSQNSKSPARKYIKIPVTETIYQTLRTHSKILDRLEFKIEKLKKQEQECRQRVSRQPLLYRNEFNSNKKTRTKESADETALNELADRLLQVKVISEEELNPKSLAYKYSVENAKRFSTNCLIQEKLKHMVNNSEVTFIRPVKVERSRKSFIASLQSYKIEKENLKPEIKEECLVGDRKPVKEVTQDNFDISLQNNAISSTPLKKISPKFEEVPKPVPSVNASSKTDTFKTIFSLPSSISMTPVMEKPKLVAEKPVENKGLTLFNQIDWSVPIPVSSTGTQQNTTVSNIPQTSIATSVLKTHLSRNALPSLPVENKSQPTLPQTEVTVVEKPADVTPTRSSEAPISGGPMFGSSTTTSDKSFFSSFSLSFTPQTAAGAEPSKNSFFTSFSLTNKPATDTNVEVKEKKEQISTNKTDAMKSESAIGTSATTAPTKSNGTTSKNVDPVKSDFSFAAIKFPESTKSEFSFVNLPKTVADKKVDSATKITAEMKPELSFVSKPVPETKREVPVTLPTAEVKPELNSVSKPTSDTKTEFSFAIKTTADTKSELSLVSKTTADTKSDFSFATLPLKTDTVSTSETFSFASLPNKTESTTIKAAEPSANSDIASELSTATKTEGDSVIPKSVAPFSFESIARSSTETTSSNVELVSTGTFGGLTITSVEKPVDANVTVPQTTNSGSAAGATSTVSFFSLPVNQPSATTASTVTTTTNIFGTATAPSPAADTKASIFGGTTSLFGGMNMGTSSTSSPLFGATSTPSPFGGGNLFASSTSGGSLFSNSESKPMFGTAGSSLFGNSETPSVFGQPTNSSAFQSGTSLFGGSETNTATATGSIFGGTQSTFGSTSMSPFQNSSSGFGSQPSFGSMSQTTQSTNTGFGGQPVFPSLFKSNTAFSAFGGAPTFGSGAAFNTSPSKVFGESSSSTMTGFGTSQQQSSTFENLASENTIGFGNLAQQQPQSNTFGSSPFGTTTTNTFGTSSFGGSSFTSWR